MRVWLRIINGRHRARGARPPLVSWWYLHGMTRGPGGPGVEVLLGAVWSATCAILYVIKLSLPLHTF